MRKVVRHGSWAAALGMGFLLGAPLFAQTPMTSSFKKSAPPVRTAALQEPQPGAANGGALDRRIEIAVELAWLADPGLFSCNLGVRAELGQVKIWGYVPTESAKQAAVRVAQHHGGLQVVDGLRVQYNMADRFAAGASLDQMPVLVQSLLVAACPTRGDTIQVQCRPDGVVTLSGVVPTWEEKLACSKSLRHVPGCMAVCNNLQVARSIVEDRNVAQSPAPAPPTTPAPNPMLTKAPEPVRMSTSPTAPQKSGPAWQSPRAEVKASAKDTTFKPAAAWETKPSDKATPAFGTRPDVNLKPAEFHPAPPAAPSRTLPPLPDLPAPAVKSDATMPQLPPALLPGLPDVGLPTPPEPAKQPALPPLPTPVETSKQPALPPAVGTTNQPALPPLPTLMTTPPNAITPPPVPSILPGPTPWQPASKPSVPAKPFESTGVLLPEPETELPAISSPGAAGAKKLPPIPTPALIEQMRQAVQKVCDQHAKNIEVVFRAPNEVRIQLTVPSESLGNVYAPRILREIPELAPYRIELEMNLPQ